MDLTRIGNEHLSVEIAPLGSEMKSITTSDGHSWLWHGDPAFWGGRSPVLFPIVGKAPDDHVTIDGQRFAMGQHGFARRSAFTLIDSGPDFCRFELTSSPATEAVYPFAFRLVIEHRVEGRAIAVSAEVTNLADRPMPFSIGFHPAFVWPLPGMADRLHSVILGNGAEPPLVRLSNGLIEPTQLDSPFAEGKLALHHDLFSADAMIFPDGAGAGLRYAAGDKAIHFTYENLPNLALWSKIGAPFICLEPWHGMAAVSGEGDAIEDRPSSDVLGPGATGRYGFKVELIG